MFSANRNGMWGAALLSVVIVLAMWGNALAAVFCPHMSGRNCCLPDQAHAHSEDGRSKALVSSDHRSMNHEHMSDMDMEVGSMDMGDTHSAVSDSEQKADVELAYDGNLTSSDNEAITQRNDPCSHCMMHSRSSDRFPISSLQNSNSDQITGLDSTPTSLKIVPSPHKIVEIHDHGPPGSTAPLYVLDGSFRI